MTDNAPSDNEDDPPAVSRSQDGQDGDVLATSQTVDGKAPVAPQAADGKDRDKEPAPAEERSDDEYSEGATPSSLTMTRAAKTFENLYPPEQTTSTGRSGPTPATSDSKRHGAASETHSPETLPVATASASAIRDPAPTASAASDSGQKRPHSPDSK